MSHLDHLATVIVACFQLNLTGRFIGVQFHADIHLFLYQKTFKARFTKFRAIEQTLTRIRACEQLRKFCEHEQASKLSKDQILRALENFKGPFDTRSLG